MTVGIAAICDNGGSVVMVADRMVSVGSHKVDTDCAKIKARGTSTLLLYSGTVSEMESIIGESSGSGDSSALQFAERLRPRWNEARQSALERAFQEKGLDPKQMLSAGKLNHVAASLASGILASFRFYETFLIAAVDRSGAQLLAINERGIVHHSEVGFATIGCGRDAAYPKCVVSNMRKSWCLCLGSQFQWNFSGRFCERLPHQRMPLLF